MQNTAEMDLIERLPGMPDSNVHAHKISTDVHMAMNRIGLSMGIPHTLTHAYDGIAD